MQVHKETAMELRELGDHFPGYRPTHDFAGRYIDASHESLATCRLDGVLIQLKNRPRFGRVIKGWLRQEDALKLYELAYFSDGDILELGCYHGLSTSILSRANRNAPAQRNIVSVDLNPRNVRKAERTLHSLGLTGNVRIVHGEAAETTKALAADGRRFGFVFVDHNHGYEATIGVCRELGSVTREGGFCLFHDFNDARNRDDSVEDYAVFQAVRDGLDPNTFEFYGIYGCTALYRARSR